MLFLSIISIALVFGSLNAQCSNYQIQNGDTIQSLAGNNTILINELMNANPNTNKSVLVQGSTLCLPVQSLSSFTICGNNSLIYTLKKGETTYTIANSTNSNYTYNGDYMTRLIIANGWMCPHYLTEGYVLCIPRNFYKQFNISKNSVDEMKPIYYTVKSGESLYSLSRGDPVLLESLMEANSFVGNATALAVNSTIRLPAIYQSIFNTSASKCKPGTIEYTVKYGDSPYTLSNNNSTLMTNLFYPNSWNCPPSLTEGSTICIPESSYFDYTLFSIKDLSGCQYYHTKAGDSFYSLQNGNGTNKRLTILDSLNPTLGQGELPAGTILCVPTYCLQKKYPFNITLPFPSFIPEHPNCTYYHTKSNDSIRTLSNGDKTLMDQLISENSLQTTSVDFPFPLGKILCIPRSQANKYSLLAKTPLDPSQCASRYSNPLDYYRISVAISGSSNGNGTTIAQLLAANPNISYYYGGSYQTGVCVPK